MEYLTLTFNRRKIDSSGSLRSQLMYTLRAPVKVLEIAQMRKVEAPSLHLPFPSLFRVERKVIVYLLYLRKHHEINRLMIDFPQLI